MNYIALNEYMLSMLKTMNDDLESHYSNVIASELNDIISCTLVERRISKIALERIIYLLMQDEIETADENITSDEYDENWNNLNEKYINIYKEVASHLRKLIANVEFMQYAMNSGNGGRQNKEKQERVLGIS